MVLVLQDMNTRELKIVQTGDNSGTLFVPELNEHYHSYKGAVRESLHVFIKNGLDEIQKKKEDIQILEVGFGTGLNALLSMEYVMKHPELTLRYTALEKYPLDYNLIIQLKYTENANNTVKELFSDIHRAPWNTVSDITERFSLLKMEVDLTGLSRMESCDLVYFDAFAPEKQPEMWEESIFKTMYEAMNVGGILVTYCAKGEVRRRLQRAGFTVERLPGPPGKREMLRAIK
ncbi:tRNA (5-methylaminomethyl-2-thiouridine)(34)-methyltransferase MnmD [Saccharicrinis sp. FJH54]|uniref:tRNA (5-methylaminomethyl-2-thiouridine)(34)-methyltransferase MnmD n=1 Tax=Saccharicrinis sp. FJH54 TaxID=3344665 RepID=UPI0035D42160